MHYRMAVALTLAGVAPLSAQRPNIARVRVDLPPINVTVPAISFSIPRIRIDDPEVQVDIPPLHVERRETPVRIPAMNIDIPGIQIDLSNLGAEIESAVRDAMSALDHPNVRNPYPSDAARIQRLRREWRDAVRGAETTGDWERADALARQLTRLADRMKR